MGWFEEQIGTRLENDQQAVQEGLSSLTSAVIGARQSNDGSRRRSMDSIGDILRYFSITPRELPSSIREVDQQLEFLLHPSGVMRRQVTLTPGWYHNAAGPMLATQENGNIVALLPKSYSGYYYVNHITGKKVAITKKNQSTFLPVAYCFYRPLPLKKLALLDLLRFVMGCLSKGDIALIAGSACLISVFGMFIPAVNNLLFKFVIPNHQVGAVLPAIAFLLGVLFSTTMLTVTKNLSLSRIGLKLRVFTAAASMGRLLGLPVEFFKNYTAGELASRLIILNELTKSISEVLLGTAFSTVFSAVYLFQIINFTPTLAIPTVLILLGQFLFSLLYMARFQYSTTSLTANTKVQGLVFSLFSGIQKIKLAGAEKRAFSKWAEVYAEKVKCAYQKRFIQVLGPSMTHGLGMLGTLIIYGVAGTSGVSVASFVAFSSAFGMASVGLAGITQLVSTISALRSKLDLAKPILQAVPELSHKKPAVERIHGGVELDSVSFRYNDNMPFILNNLSLKIRPGQSVAIVGRTGCGKSTLIRLLLGFEQPQKGSVYYDGRDLQKVDPKSIRQKIGVVLQNAQLFPGDIYSNIVVSAPWLRMEDAWEAAELAQIAQDIRNMPMGMYTLLSEGGGGISGGQRQRLMIARAIAAKPKILFFDEATSGLDNITQKAVTDALNALNCTRIIVAHRLSIIKGCDRIIVLEEGKIIEDGNYEQLIAADGFFADLVHRQQVTPVSSPPKNPQ